MTNLLRTLLMGAGYFLQHIVLKYITFLHFDVNIILHCRICAVQQQKENGSYQSIFSFVLQSDTCIETKKLITMLSRLGHSETYDFGLEIETALVKAIAQQSLNVTPPLHTGEANEVFHMEWDNLNKITTPEVRPKSASRASTSLTPPNYKREKSRSLKVDFPAILPPAYAYDRVGPAFPTNA